MTASLGYQGIGADKGINLQVAQPDLFAPGFGFFVEISGNETAGVGKGQSSHVHENYLLWHAGGYWESVVSARLYWTWLLGVGMNLPSGALENKSTFTATARSGLEYEIGPSIRSFLMVGIEMNLWNRATEFEAAPYYGRGTTTQFGFRLLL
jgi:hypothetical protein